MTNSKLVYSTGSDNNCNTCGKPLRKCSCAGGRHVTPSNDGVVTVSRESKGRKGKGVTLIKGVNLPADELKALSKKLKTTCGTGGAVKDGTLEIQGDKRQLVKTFLEAQDFKVKLSGG